MVAIGALLAGGGSAIGGLKDRITQPAQKALNQSINISVGDIDVKQIIKYLLFIVILLAILIVLIQGARGYLIWQDQTACGLSNIGCDWGEGIGLGNACKQCQPEQMPSYFWMWGNEWYARCLLFLGMAGIAFLLLYQWFMKIIHYLLRFDMYFKKIEDWIYGSSLEGEAERQISTRL